MFRTRLLLTTLAAAVLTGCGAPALPTGATKAASAGLGAKASPKEFAAVVAQATNATFERTTLGVTAVLRAPTDVVAQRGLANLYAQAIDKVLPVVDKSIDEALWPGTMADFQKQFPAVTDAEVQAYVDGIAARLAKAAGSKPFKVFVSHVPWADAFNAGGHAMMLFSELIRSGTADESELAAIMAHEIVHGIRRHALEARVMDLSSKAARHRVTQIHALGEEELTLASSHIAALPARTQQDSDAVLGHLTGKVGEDAMANVRFWLNDTFAVITLRRDNEAEADALGVRILAAAGYDPQGAVRVFERMNAHAAGDDRYYDHPPLGSRAGALKQIIAQRGLKGEDRGVERHQAIAARLAPKAPGATEIYQPPAEAAGAGCVHGRPWQSIR